MTFRYSKLKLFYDMLDLIKNNLFILFILFLNAGSNSMFMNIVQWGAIAVFGFSFLFRIYETLFTKVVFAEDGIHIHKGLFSKSEQFIPREKFENVQTQANVLQRLFGVQSITMETGEATSDVTLKAVIYKQNGYQKLLGVTTIKLISAGEILPSEDQNLNEFFPYLPTEKFHE
ncbi:PH domain-containing protein, partial [Geobacillus thermoleovorans]|uniref:PH domain-containing protein n=1 Tax=Geobacillus thermoleovorans TaxID=33941 RepID=UPI003DA5566C